jgi:carbonic anhydrase/SulP family sulfate permease
MDAEAQQARIDELYRTHLLRTIEHLPARSPALRRLIDEGNVGIVGCMYDVRSGQVEFFS